MTVLVGITTRNRCQVLPKAIQSALDQDFESLHVTVYDDNSSDDTHLLEGQFPDVSWETGAETCGLVSSRNKMMKEAHATYFCSLDDDAWFVTPDVIRTAVGYLNKHHDVAAIALDILSPDAPDIKKRAKPYEVSNFIGCGHVLRLDAVRQVGYYDTYPSLYGAEEMDLCIKLLDTGYRVIYLPGVHIWHDKFNLARDEKNKYKSLVCNDLAFMYRRSPLVFLIPGLVLKMLSHLRFSATYRKGILFLAGLKGIIKFLTLFFKLLRKPVRYHAFFRFYKLSGINR